MFRQLLTYEGVDTELIVVSQDMTLLWQSIIVDTYALLSGV